MADFAQLPNIVRKFVALPTISSFLQATLELSLLSDQHGLEWKSVEEYLASRLKHEPVEVAAFMSWLIRLAPISQHSAAIKSRRHILQALAANEKTRAAALDMIDQLGRKGIHGYQGIYERYA
jgi:hypothetical protein